MVVITSIRLDRNPDGTMRGLVDVAVTPDDANLARLHGSRQRTLVVSLGAAAATALRNALRVVDTDGWPEDVEPLPLQKA